MISQLPPCVHERKFRVASHVYYFGLLWYHRPFKPKPAVVFHVFFRFSTEYVCFHGIRRHVSQSPLQNRCLSVCSISRYNWQDYSFRAISYSGKSETASGTWIQEHLCNTTIKLFCAVSNIGHAERDNIHSRFAACEIVQWQYKFVRWKALGEYFIVLQAWKEI